MENQVQSSDIPEISYKAFISYRHLALDKEAAERIQKGIEHYIVPKEFRHLSGGKKLKCTVKVTTNPSLNKTKASVKKGKKFTLKVSGKATSAQFASSNKKIAVVSKSGVIKGVSKGKVTIKVAVNGVTLKCIVTVK